MILREFTKRCRESNVSVDAFIREITEENEQHEYFHQCMELRGRMTDLHTQIIEHQMPEPVEQLPEKTLREFCTNNPILDMSAEDCLKAIEAVQHGEALRTLHEIISYRKSGSKIHVLWLWGKASTGKSFFIRHLREIFAATEVQWKGDYLPQAEQTKPELKT